MKGSTHSALFLTGGALKTFSAACKVPASLYMRRFHARLVHRAGKRGKTAATIAQASAVKAIRTPKTNMIMRVNLSASLVAAPTMPLKMAHNRPSTPKAIAAMRMRVCPLAFVTDVVIAAMLIAPRMLNYICDLQVSETARWCQAPGAHRGIESSFESQSSPLLL